MRSHKEIAFRLRQETNNLRLLISQPRLGPGNGSLCPLLQNADRSVECIRNTSGAIEILNLAEQIMKHSFPLLGVTVNTGTEIDWRRDYLHGRSSRKIHFRRIPYLDFDAVGDHKIIWELNRHQHLVLLAQAYCLTARPELLDEIVNQLRSWFSDNPFPRGINWASALEVGFRALSWIWIYHLAGNCLPGNFQMDLAAGLHLHALHLEQNLSIFFSPNTHLLGEAVALHAIGVLFPDFPGSARFRSKGREIVELQMESQVREDGSHFEQSSYYHVYALDLFMLHAILTETPPTYKQKLAKMGDFLNALLGPSRLLPLMGDDDGGRVFHPYGPRSEFGRASLATCSRLIGARWPFEAKDFYQQASWWVGGPSLPSSPLDTANFTASQLFRDSGVLVMTEGDIQVIFDGGSFGGGSAGHSHSDSLSLIVRRGTQDILLDQGTYRYVGDRAARDWFRGSSAHNTIRIDGHDQAMAAGPFLWRDKPVVEIAAASADFLDASCHYKGFVHRRRLHWLRAKGVLFVLDEITGPEGVHLVEQFWHPGEPITTHSPCCVEVGANTTLIFTKTPDLMNGWRSTVLYERRPTTMICVTQTGYLPLTMGSAIDFSGRTRHSLRVVPSDRGVWLEISGSPDAVMFPDDTAHKRI
jgi:Heparinase II/III-like protein/Heparinase II/III N-terminus